MQHKVFIYEITYKNFHKFFDIFGGNINVLIKFEKLLILYYINIKLIKILKKIMHKRIDQMDF